MADARPALVIFARAPVLGGIKTRLAAALGAPLALAIYREMGRRTVDAARNVPHCRLIVQYTGAGGAQALANWLGEGAELRAQAAGDLGQRMLGAITDALAGGAPQVVVVGTDCPALDAASIEGAFAALEHADVVLGPATDGGYYLIGMAQPHAALFEDIPWSTGAVLRTTLGAAAAAGLGVRLLEPRRDIDTAADWMEWLDALPPDQAAALRRDGLDPRRPPSAPDAQVSHDGQCGR